MPCPEAALLHALLDGALAPEIARGCERHIADCPLCRAARDGAALLRDDATALLGRTAVHPRSMPAFGVLVARAAARDAEETVVPLQADSELPAPEVSSLRRRRRGALQAAGIAAAACAGWLAYSTIAAPSAAPVAVALVQQPFPTALPAAPELAPMRSAAPQEHRSLRPPRRATVETAASFQEATPTSSSTETRAEAPTDNVPLEVPQSASNRPPEPVVRIQALEPGASALTVRTDYDFRLRADVGEDDAPPSSASAVSPAYAPARSAASATYPAAKLRLRQLNPAAGASDSSRFPRMPLRRLTP